MGGRARIARYGVVASAALAGALVAVALSAHPTRASLMASPSRHHVPLADIVVRSAAPPPAQSAEPTPPPSAPVVTAIAGPAQAAAAPPARAPSLPRRPAQVAMPPVAARGADCVVSALDGRTLSLLGQDRARAGVPQVTADAALCRAAAEHAAQNAAQDQMSHAAVVEDVHAQGLSPHNLGEVLGTWHPTPDIDSINGMWMQSPPHEGVIDSSVYTAVGVGWAQAANGDWFVSAIFTS